MSTPSFSVHDPSTGETVKSLKSCHIERKTFTRNDLPAYIAGGDGHIYKAVYDCRFPPDSREVDVIISFQQHDYGKFAVVRIARNKKRSVTL